MLNQEEKEYYSRQTLLPIFGENSQILLKKANILIVGAGGLACTCLQYLVSAGVGNITIIDGDKVSLSNLHRQTLFNIYDIGLKKVNAVSEKLKKNNPFIKIDVVDEYFSIENGGELIKCHDFVIDCTDNFPTRYLINDFCILNDKAMIYGAIDQFNGQVSVFNYKNGPSYRCLFPAVKENSNILNCAEAGVVGVLPGVIGCFQALECIKLICGIGNVLSGKLLIYQALEQQSFQLKINKKDIDYKFILLNNGVKLENFNCETESFNGKSIKSLDELFSENFVILDVRNLDEYPRIKNMSVIEIPLGNLNDCVDDLPKDKLIVCVCKSGIRSKKAADILIQHIDKEFIVHFDNLIENLI